MALIVVRMASSEQNSFAIAASFVNGLPCCASQAAWNIRCLPASISVAMSDSWNCTPWNSQIGLPNCLRTVAYRMRLLERALGEA